MKHLFLQPHNDDAVLFGAFTLQRYKRDIEVVTVFESYRQGADSRFVRIGEDVHAFKALGLEPPTQMILRDDKEYGDEQVRAAILKATREAFSVVWAPAVYDSDGHVQHNQVGRVAAMLSPNVRYYHTYLRRVDGKVSATAFAPEFRARQCEESKPEFLSHVHAKLRALACYKSQIERTDNVEHFLRDQREWVVPA